MMKSGRANKRSKKSKKRVFSPNSSTENNPMKFAKEEGRRVEVEIVPAQDEPGTSKTANFSSDEESSDQEAADEVSANELEKKVIEKIKTEPALKDEKDESDMELTGLFEENNSENEYIKK